MRVLLQLGSNIEARANDRSTPLHFAALAGHVEAIRVLVQNGAELGVVDDRGKTPFQFCLEHGHPEAAQVLRELIVQKAAATSERAQQAARQATEQANRMAAELIEEEERDQAECRLKAQLAAAQKEVRLAPSSPRVELHSSTAPRCTRLSAHCMWCARGMGRIAG